jgi:hypothetical protein
MLDKDFLKGVEFGLVGGVVGTILMDTVMVTTFLMAGEPWDTFFRMVGEKFGDGAVIGIALHNVVGLTGGFVFSLLVLSIQYLRIDTRRKGIALGIAAGAITIPVGCIPLAVWLDEPILIVIAFSALPHMVWGTVLGLIMGYGLLSLKIRPSPA